jgi:hypothetical protein
MGSNITVKISLHDFEAYELSPYSKPPGIQRTSSTASIGISCCINALNCCVYYLCLRGWVYVFYIGHIDKIM